MRAFSVCILLLWLVIISTPGFCAPFQDKGPILHDFDGKVYEAVLTGSNGTTARFGMKQISPYQMLVSRGRLLVVYGTKGDVRENESRAREEISRWNISVAPSPNWPAPEIRLASDVQVTDADLAQQDVVLVGNDESNLITAKLAGKLPMTVRGSSVEMGDCGTLGSVMRGRFLAPNPYNESQFIVVSFGKLEQQEDDLHMSAAYRWNAALTYFWHMTDYSFVTRDGTVRGGYFAKPERTHWSFDPKLMVTVPNVLRDPYKNWKVRQTPHFIFRYSPGSATELKISSMGDTWDNQWEQLYAELSKSLEITYDRKIHVFLFSDWEEAGRCAAVGFSPIQSGSQKAAGLTDAKHGVIMLMGTDNAAPNATARHEVAHILAETIAPPVVPLNAEGLACHAEGKWPSQTGGRTLREWECSYIDTYSTFPPLSVLFKSQGFNGYPVRDSYPLANSFTSFLIERYGLKKYKEYYKLAATSDPETAIKQIYAKSAGEIEKEWHETVRIATESIRKAAILEQSAYEAYSKRRFDEACQKATTAAALNPNVSLAYFLIGASHNRMKRSNPDEALSALEKYLSSLQRLGQPEQPWLFIEMGYAYDTKGEREKAVFCYNKAVLLPDDRGSKSEAQRRLTEPYRKDGR